LPESSELVIARLAVGPSRTVSLHAHRHSELLFLFEGRAQVQRELGVAELSAPGAAYFPANTFHAVSGLESGCEALLCYPRGDGEASIETTMATSETDRSSWSNPNLISAEQPLFRWAVAEDFEPAVGIEPTKGLSLTVRYLFGPERGAPDVAAGTCRQVAKIHYTMHRHQPPEIYYVLDGSGLIYVGNEAHAVSAGSTVYVPSGVPHGIDTDELALHYFWLYGLDRTGPNWTWQAVEDVYHTPGRYRPDG
jgi:quercetin dioxygenase-like cupin family protein